MLRKALVFSIAVRCIQAWTTGRNLAIFGATRLTASVEQQQYPCWEDLYDDDCAMSNVYSASFVASEWIKSMPCASGLDDCDIPSDLTLPETRPEAGVEQVDVMRFLGLTRAASIHFPDKSEN
ncbi:hypothetical protein ACA910_012853 [Epithemia clementina (nom. ined.)]